MNVALLLDMAADGYADRVVVGRRSDGITAAELQRRSCAGAALVRSARADALVYLGVNGPAFPVALFAAARAGVPLVPLNYRLGADQLSSLLANHPHAMILIGEDSRVAFRIPSTATVMTVGDWLASTANDTAGGTGNGELVTDDADDTAPAVLIYTSGTTSEPKAVLLRHANLVSYVLGSVEFAAADEADASLVSVPPYHVAAVANVITNLYAGRRFVVLEQFTDDTWLATVRAEGITHALVVPTMLARIMSGTSDKAVPSLRSLAYGGAAMPLRVIETALREWPAVDFVNAYGLTETSSTISVLGPADHRAAVNSDDPQVRARLGSAGTPLPTIEVQIRDDSQAAVPAGCTGRIWVRGDQISGEYAGSGSALDAQGWFDTRDEGHLDEEGFLFIGGRVDDTIIRGGENIAPAEVENTILSHAGIEDAVVVGLPDDVWGQRLAAAVVAARGVELDPEEIREFVRLRLRGSKTPDHVVVWDELPRTETGKIIRRSVVARIAGEHAPAT